MSALSVGSLQRPSLTYTVKLEEGAEKTIKLSYGLFQDLQRLVPDAALLVDTIAADPNTRDYLIRRCLTDTKKFVKDWDELADAETLGLDDPDEINGLLQWVTGHLLYFFGISAGGLKQLSERLAQKLSDQPAPSTLGSET